MTSFIETHCHLDKLTWTVPEALQRASDAGVQKLLTIAVDAESLDFVTQTAGEHERVYGALGIHPHDAAQYSAAVAQQIEEQATRERIVAVGETGLDYHYMYAEREVQQEAFCAQLQQAERLQLPVVLHTRDAEEDTLRILKDHSVSRRGVAHSFTGSCAMAQQMVEMGWLLGVNGIVTFKNAQDLRDTLKVVPLSSIILETDSPFLAPIPFRGKPNDPSRIPIIAEFLATWLEIPLEQLAEQTNENAQQLFQFA
jgi:TatD DNase family protein